MNLEWDKRRNLAIPGGPEETLQFTLTHILTLYHKAVQDHGLFFVALSGGSTPHELYQRLCLEKIDWSKVALFWSDERAVPKDDPKSNYHMAMEAGFKMLPLYCAKRMEAEEKIEENALAYEKAITSTLQGRPFDLILLGCGDDGHTASLFPHTEALKAKGRLVIANFVPKLNSWRMTFTFDLINRAQNTIIYVLGPSKKEVIKTLLTSPEQIDLYPIQAIGTEVHKALWILDREAASALLAK